MDGRYGIGVVLSAVLLAVLVVALRPQPASEPVARDTVANVDEIPVDSAPEAVAELAPADSEQDDAQVIQAVDISAEDFESLTYELFANATWSYNLFYFQEIVGGDDFYRAIDGLSADRSATAAYLYAELRTRLERRREIQDGTMTIDRMGCGRRLCLIVISGVAVSRELRGFDAGVPYNRGDRSWSTWPVYLDDAGRIQLRLMMIPIPASGVHFHSRPPSDG